MTLRRNIKRAFTLLPEVLQGHLEYRLRPSLLSGFGPFNNQAVRTAIFKRLLADCDIGQIVETGTFRGTTTALFAETGLPVHSVEVSKKYYTYSKSRLRAFANVHLYHGKSVSRLPGICGHLAETGRTSFVYLDSHWHDYLPLRDEIEILSRRLANSVVMIDDFQVPYDDGYTFDDYGGGERICIDYLLKARTPSPLFVYFPVAASGEETGSKRGTCVVALTPAIKQRLDAIELLRFYRASDCPFGAAD